MQINRDQFLEEGFLVLREVIPPKQLEGLRRAYEILVERQKVIWARQRNPDDPPGGIWDYDSQPRLNLGGMTGVHDVQTASAVEIWLHENVQGVSTRLLDEEDAAVTEMMLMCSPVRDHGIADHRGWHRDLYPPRSAPLKSYVDDIIETGPRYVQWNIPLYDDDVLWVVPGSHNRCNTEEEDAKLNESPGVPLRGALQTRLEAGDGVVYILPLLHWGSNYNSKMRRTIHGGFSVFTHYHDLSFLKHLSETAQTTFERWHRCSKQKQHHTEKALRAALDRNGAAYYDALDQLHPGRGEKGQIYSTICLSKVAKRIHQLKGPDFDELPEDERSWATETQAMALQWGGAFADRFCTEEAISLWARFKPIDDAMQAPEIQWSPGFQGEPTSYYFNQAPGTLSIERTIAGE